MEETETNRGDCSSPFSAHLARNISEFPSH
jgi:hypothetical protein